MPGKTTSHVTGLIILLALATGSVLLAAEEDSEAYMIAQGRVTYKVYCANCHGAMGLGDGVLSEYLTVDPSDLTQIQANNGGVFPSDATQATIDGRVPVRGHGSKEMPVWGDAFQKTLQPTWKDASDEERATGKIREVVQFLKSIQEPNPN